MTTLLNKPLTGRMIANAALPFFLVDNYPAWDFNDRGELVKSTSPQVVEFQRQSKEITKLLDDLEEKIAAGEKIPYWMIEKFSTQGFKIVEKLAHAGAITKEWEDQYREFLQALDNRC